MTREEFLALPPGIALGVLYDQMPQRMATLPVPAIPRPPKYDGRVARKGGFCWMSEMDLSSLRYWHGKKSEGGKVEFAEKDAKTAKELSYWIAWRTADPQSTWRGERNRVATSAKAPSREPDIHPWERRSPASETAATDDYSGGGSDDDYGFT